MHTTFGAKCISRTQTDAACSAVLIDNGNIHEEPFNIYNQPSVDYRDYPATARSQGVKAVIFRDAPCGNLNVETPEFSGVSALSGDERI